MSKEDRTIKRLLQAAIKMSPLLYVLAGATGTYYSLKGDVDDLKREMERHTGGLDHDPWFSDDRILHPSLRGGIDREIDRAIEERIQRLKDEHRLWPCELDADRKWDRLFDLNPSLRRS